MVKFVKLEVNLHDLCGRPVWRVGEGVPPAIVRAVEKLVGDSPTQTVVKVFEAPPHREPSEIPLAKLEVWVGPFGRGVTATLPARTGEEVERVAHLLKLVKKILEAGEDGEPYDTMALRVVPDIIELMYNLTTVDENLITYSISFDNPHGEGWVWALTVEETWSD